MKRLALFAPLFLFAAWLPAAQQHINLVAPTSSQNDTPYIAFGKAETNFTYLFSILTNSLGQASNAIPYLDGSGTNLTMVGNNEVQGILAWGTVQLRTNGTALEIYDAENSRSLLQFTNGVVIAPFGIVMRPSTAVNNYVWTTDGTGAAEWAASQGGGGGGTGSGETNTLTSAGTVVGLVNPKIGTGLFIKGLIGVHNISIATNATDAIITISLTPAFTSLTVTNAATVGGLMTAAYLKGTGITASRAVVTDAGGVLTNSATTAAEIGFVSGVTSSIQAQINSITAANTNGFCSTNDVFPIVTNLVRFATTSSAITVVTSTPAAGVRLYTISGQATNGFVTSLEASNAVRVKVDKNLTLTRSGGDNILTNLLELTNSPSISGAVQVGTLYDTNRVCPRGVLVYGGTGGTNVDISMVRSVSSYTLFLTNHARLNPVNLSNSPVLVHCVQAAGGTWTISWDSTIVKTKGSMAYTTNSGDFFDIMFSTGTNDSTVSASMISDNQDFTFRGAVTQVEVPVSYSGSGSSNLVLDLRLGNTFTATLTKPTWLAVTNWPSPGTNQNFELVLRENVSGTWPLRYDSTTIKTNNTFAHNTNAMSMNKVWFTTISNGVFAANMNPGYQ